MPWQQLFQRSRRDRKITLPRTGLPHTAWDEIMWERSGLEGRVRYPPLSPFSNPRDVAASKRRAAIIRVMIRARGDCGSGESKMLI